MNVVSSQGPSLLSVDLSGSDVTDNGLIHLKDCANLQALNFNYCDQISDLGLERIRGIVFFLASHPLQLFCYDHIEAFNLDDQMNLLYDCAWESIPFSMMILHVDHFTFF